MNIRRQRKKKLAFVPRNYSDWCCKMCYFGWGPGAKYKHDCCESNNAGILKKYWKEYDVMTGLNKFLNEGEDNGNYTS